jgi:hypothetical protein
MTASNVPRRHGRSYDNDPLPSPQEALNEPFAAFPSWFLRIECERCHKVQWLNQAHMPRSELPLRTLLARMRHAEIVRCRREEVGQCHHPERMVWEPKLERLARVVDPGWRGPRCRRQGSPCPRLRFAAEAARKWQQYCLNPAGA